MMEKFKIVVAALGAIGITIFLLFISAVKFEWINLGDEASSNENNNVINNTNNNDDINANNQSNIVVDDVIESKLTTCSMTSVNNNLITTNTIELSSENDSLVSVDDKVLISYDSDLGLEEYNTQKSLLQTKEQTYGVFSGITPITEEGQKSFSLRIVYDINSINESEFDNASINKTNIKIQYTKNSNVVQIINNLKAGGYTCN